MRTRILSLSTFLLALILLACISDGKVLSKDITGDWYAKTNSSDRFTYQEMYITDSVVYRSDNHFGLKPAYRYTIENDTMYLMDWGSGVKFPFGKMDLEQEAILFTNDNYQYRFESLSNETSTLGQFIRKEINEDEYYEGYSRRFENIEK